MKVKSEKPKAAAKLRHDPLAAQMAKDLVVEESEAKGKGRRAAQKAEKAARDDDYVPAKLTQRILKETQKMSKELVHEDDSDNESMTGGVAASKNSLPRNVRFQLQADDGSDNDEEEDLELGEGYDEEELELDEDEAAAFDMFMPKSMAGPSSARSGPAAAGTAARSLADIILEKIRVKESKDSDAAPVPAPLQEDELIRSQLDPKVVQVYTAIGRLLASYTSGKLPKAFKIIPALSNWEEILYLTAPDSWSPHAVYRATRLFASNLNAKLAQRFYNLLLLPRVREDIQQHRKLNFHLYISLRKALFKPLAFYKGILLPLCEAGDCTLREAHIIGSVLSRTSIPVLHSAVAMLKIAEMDFTSTNSYFLNVLIDKKYALPYKVIDSLVIHFVRQSRSHRRNFFPYHWHKALLCFVQRYKSDLTEVQRVAILETTAQQVHPILTKELQRELEHLHDRARVSSDPDAQDISKLQDTGMGIVTTEAGTMAM